MARFSHARYPSAVTQTNANASACGANPKCPWASVCTGETVWPQSATVPWLCNCSGRFPRRAMCTVALANGLWSAPKTVPAAADAFAKFKLQRPARRHRSRMGQSPNGR